MLARALGAHSLGNWGTTDMKTIVFAKAVVLPAAAAIAVSLASGPVAAEDKQQLTPGIVEQIDLASKLTNYGVERNDPLLLLAAARLIATVAPDPAAPTPALSASELVEKAKAIAGGKGEIATLADQVASEIPRGLCYGPGTVYGCF
jgi:hypothetical protein